MLLLWEDTDSNSIHFLRVITKCLALEWSLSYVAFFCISVWWKRPEIMHRMDWGGLLWHSETAIDSSEEGMSIHMKGIFLSILVWLNQNKKQQNLLFEVYDFPRLLGQCSGKWRTPLPATSATLGQLLIISVDLFGSCIMLSHLWWALGASRLPEG